MSTHNNNNDNNESNFSLWEDSNIDPEVLREINKYCEERKKKPFTIIARNFIEKARRAGDTFGDILVSSQHLLVITKSLEIIHSLVHLSQWTALALPSL